MPSADFESKEPAPLRPRQDPPAPPPAPAVAPGVADLLLLARALMREGDSLPGAQGPGAKSGQPASPGQTRGPLPKEQKKFYKLGNRPAPLPTPAPTPVRELPPASAAPPGQGPVAVPAPGMPTLEFPVSLPEDEDKEEEEKGVTPVPVAPAAPERAAIRPSRPLLNPVEERSGGRRRLMSRKQRVFVIAMGVSFALGSFFVGLFLGWMARPPVQKSPVPGPVAAQAPSAAAPTLALRVWVPDENLRRALATVDEAAVAHAAGDWMRMASLLEQSGREAGPNGVPGLIFHQAENAVRQGNLNMANTLAQRCLDSGEDVAKAYALRAVIAQRSNRPEVALSLLEAAGRADPFEGRYLFYQAQSLRGRGKLQEATTRLRRALDRVEDFTLAESYRLVLRLTQVELGEDAVFGEELARNLAESNPAPDWLVTAAARDCQAGRLRDGAEFLRRAFARAAPGYAAARLGDVFFRPYADRPELASLFAQYVPPNPVPASSPAVFSKPNPDLMMPSGEPGVAPVPPAGPEAAPTAETEATNLLQP